MSTGYHKRDRRGPIIGPEQLAGYASRSVVRESRLSGVVLWSVGLGWRFPVCDAVSQNLHRQTQVSANQMIFLCIGYVERHLKVRKQRFCVFH
jgi:hypothetical protein